MDWGTLAATALGALLGAGSTMAADLSRWKRDHTSREREVKRGLYGEYLAAISVTTHELRALRHPNSLTHDELKARAEEVLSASNAYQLRYQVRITAPALEDVTEHAFRALRGLRDRFKEPDVFKDPGWDEAVEALTDAINELMQAMRDDLHGAG